MQDPPRSSAAQAPALAMEVSHVADVFRRELTANSAASLDSYLERVPPAARQKLREELIGEQFSHLYGDLLTLKGALRYRVTDHLGSGHFGSVYKAEDLELGRCVALKVLVTTDTEERHYFRQEAKLHASLRHANIVGVYDRVTLPKGHECLVMQCVEGSTLRDHLVAQGGRLRPTEAATIMRDVARALIAMHSGSQPGAAPLVHRDLKPENVFISRDGSALLGDFGLAAAVADLHVKRCRLGGTPAYLSPEQARAFQPPHSSPGIDTRSDVWAAGAILYEVLAGSPPFTSNKPTKDERLEEVVDGILRFEPTALRDLAPNVPPELEHIVRRCLTKDVAARLDSMRKVAAELDHYLDTADRLLPIDFNEHLRYLASLNQSPLDWLSDEIDAWSAATSPVDRAVCLQGAWGSGKSVFLASWANSGHSQIAARHFCRASLPETQGASRFIRSIAGMLQRSLPGYAAALRDSVAGQNAIERMQWLDDPRGAFQAIVIDPLLQARLDAETVSFIIVDALDEADLSASVTIPDLVQMWHATLPSAIRLVVSVRRGAPPLEQIAGCRLLAIENGTSPKTRQPGAKAGVDELSGSVHRFILARLRQPNLAERLQCSGLGEEAAASILLRKSQANFLCAAKALDGLEKDLVAFSNLEELPPGLGSALTTFFQRQWPTRQEYSAVKPVVEVLVAAAEPIPDALISCASGVAQEQVSEAMEALSQYVTRASATTTWMHNAIPNWLRETSSFYRVLPQQGHRRIAAACDAAFASEKSGTDKLTPYAISHWVHHLVQGQLWEELQRVLMDDDYRRHKQGEGFLQDIHAATIALPAEGSLHRTLTERGRSVFFGPLVTSCMSLDFKKPWETHEFFSRSVECAIAALRELFPGARSDWEAMFLLSRTNRYDEVRQLIVAKLSEATDLYMPRKSDKAIRRRGKRNR
jgi:serine/threonine protein kinase